MIGINLDSRTEGRRKISDKITTVKEGCDRCLALFLIAVTAAIWWGVGFGYACAWVAFVTAIGAFRGNRRLRELKAAKSRKRSPPPSEVTRAGIEALRRAGGDGWDRIEDPKKFLREVTGE